MPQSDNSWSELERLFGELSAATVAGDMETAKRIWNAFPSEPAYIPAAKRVVDAMEEVLRAAE